MIFCLSFSNFVEKPCRYEEREVRFDWAMRRLLRNKANYSVLEGFLTTLLGHSIKIRSLLESESNLESPEDKGNRVDMLAENENGERLHLSRQDGVQGDEQQ